METGWFQGEQLRHGQRISVVKLGGEDRGHKSLEEFEVEVEEGNFNAAEMLTGHSMQKKIVMQPGELHGAVGRTRRVDRTLNFTFVCSASLGTVSFPQPHDWSSRESFPCPWAEEVEADLKAHSKSQGPFEELTSNVARWLKAKFELDVATTVSWKKRAVEAREHDAQVPSEAYTPFLLTVAVTKHWYLVPTFPAKMPASYWL